MTAPLSMAFRGGAARSSPSAPLTLSSRASMRAIKYTSRFKRDYRREKSGVLGKRLDALLNLVLRVVRNIFA